LLEWVFSYGHVSSGFGGLAWKCTNPGVSVEAVDSSYFKPNHILALSLIRLYVALGTGTGSPIIMGTHGEFWRSVILLQRPCSTRFLEILEVIEQFRISSPSMNLPFARGPRHPRLSPQKKITVELKFRHAHTLCSSEIAHQARLESPANPRRCGIRPRHLDARRGTTPSFPGEPNDFERIRDR
jgi:hypothetical protein